MYLCHLTFHNAHLSAYINAFESVGASLSWDATAEDHVDFHESPQEVTTISVKAYMDTAALGLVDAGEAAVMAFIQTLLKTHDLTPATCALEPLPETDWLAENRNQFPPISLGKFVFYSPLFEAALPADQIPLKINAALAFGSGEHETTKGCIIALERIKETHPHFKNMMDMGCGSGILSLVMAHLWTDAEIHAYDFDENAVALTQENATANNFPHIHAHLSEGFADVGASKSDLIAANILAKPLIDMAADIAHHLNPGGMVVLSGMLENQSNAVHSAYHGEGLSCTQRFSINEWTTLVFQKEGPTT